MYSAKIDGEPTTFGTSGFLYRSNKLMYDRKTNTLWKSFDGVPVIGELAQRDDLKLDFYPVAVTMWEDWLAEHPETTVISPETGYYPPSFYRPEEDQRAIYFDYRATPNTMFPIWDRDDRLEAKDEILGVSDGDVHKAYAVHDLQQLRVINDAVGHLEVVIVASNDTPDARVFHRDGRTFSLDANADASGVPRSVVDSDGAIWEVRDDGLHGTGGNESILARIPDHHSFWFGWYAFRPGTTLYSPN